MGALVLRYRFFIIDLILCVYCLGMAKPPKQETVVINIVCYPQIPIRGDIPHQHRGVQAWFSILRQDAEGRKWGNLGKNFYCGFHRKEQEAGWTGL